MPRTAVSYAIFFILLLLSATSCTTQKLAGRLLYDPKEVADLSSELGVSLNNTDKEDDRNMPLYAEVSLWLGTPYQYGGLSRKGVDCSGFAYLIYQSVYKKKIPRSTSGLSNMKMYNVSKRGLQAGDLVFFATPGNSGKISHVGIYLKDSCFVHASTSKGVIVSRLNEAYYIRAWKRGGRVK
jgi:lipoprotein Spr